MESAKLIITQRIDDEHLRQIQDANSISPNDMIQALKDFSIGDIALLQKLCLSFHQLTTQDVTHR
jgi:hypothetical protein